MLERPPELARAGCSRRGFVKAFAAATAACALPSVLAAAHSSREAFRSEAGRKTRTYVDIHTHLGQRWGARSPLSADAMLWWMDEHSVDQAAVLPLINPEARAVPISTNYVLEQTAPHRDRLIPFCTIDPRTIHLDGVTPKRDLLLRYKEAGARGFGEHKVGLPIDDPRNLELYSACAEAGLPVLIHMDTLRNSDRPGLPGLETVLREVPDGIFIGHAQAFWASISGDVSAEEMQRYPKGDVAPGGALDRLMDDYPNLYADLSAGSGANGIGRDPAFGRSFLIRRADRVLFGSDYLEPMQNIPQFELLESLDLPAEVERQIYRENARRLLGLSE